MAMDAREVVSSCASSPPCCTDVSANRLAISFIIASSSSVELSPPPLCPCVAMIPSIHLISVSADDCSDLFLSFTITSSSSFELSPPPFGPCVAMVPSLHLVPESADDCSGLVLFVCTCPSTEVQSMSIIAPFGTDADRVSVARRDLFL